MDWGLAKVLPAGRRRRRRDGRASRGRTRRSSPRPGAASTTRDLSQAGVGAGHARLHGARSRPAARSTGSTSGPTSSRLGSILCEILTGQPAFTGRTSGEILRKAARGDLADALGPAGRLRGRRRAGRPGTRLPGPRAGGPPAGRRGGRRPPARLHRPVQRRCARPRWPGPPRRRGPRRPNAPPRRPRPGPGPSGRPVACRSAASPWRWPSPWWVGCRSSSGISNGKPAPYASRRPSLSPGPFSTRRGPPPVT